MLQIDEAGEGAVLQSRNLVIVQQPENQSTQPLILGLILMGFKFMTVCRGKLFQMGFETPKEFFHGTRIVFIERKIRLYILINN